METALRGRGGARWVEAAGARVRLGQGEQGVEVSPRVSYSGEGLAPLCRGRTLRSARDAFLQVRPGKIVRLPEAVCVLRYLHPGLIRALKAHVLMCDADVTEACPTALK